jgi:CHAT domain-containing protein
VLMLTGPASRRLGDRRNITQFVTIVSAPIAVAPGGITLPFLNFADRETSEVMAHFQNITYNRMVLSGPSATVENIAAVAPQTTIFHFAGHGWSNGGNGALLLPPETRSSNEPHFITSRELSRQDWHSCALAVLSACLTATGEGHGAVNNESLVQALLSAGVGEVIAARWSVDSQATCALMARFYSRLGLAKDPAAALAGASSEIASMGEWKHPYYWASFDVFGKGRIDYASK